MDTQLLLSLDTAIADAFKAGDRTTAIKLMRLKDRKLSGRRRVTGGSKSTDIISGNIRSHTGNYADYRGNRGKKATRDSINRLVAKFS